MLAIATTSNGFASNQDATLHGVKKNQTIWRIAFPTQKYFQFKFDWLLQHSHEWFYFQRQSYEMAYNILFMQTNNQFNISQFLSQVFSWAHTKY
jgi:hypothetical protein